MGINAFILLILLSFSVNAETLYNYKVVKIVDGDTFTIKVDFLPEELGDRINIRILGIDTPEMRGRCIDEVMKAKEAKNYLAKIVKDNDYRVIIKGRDKYFRLIGDLKIGDKYVSKMMIDGGYAVSYNGKIHKQSWCN